MASSRHLVVANVVLFLVVTCSSAYEEPAGTYCNPNSGIVRGGPVAINIDNLLAGLIPAFKGGARFISTSYGEGKNVVYGLAQCWGESTEKECSECIQAAAQQIQNSCIDFSDAQIWYYECTLRYSQHRFLGKFDSSNGVVLDRIPNEVRDPQSLSNLLGQLFNELSNEVIDPNGEGFATGGTKLSGFGTLAGVAECTKDLSSFACAQCLDAAINQFQSYCGPSMYCRVLYSSCAVAYLFWPSRALESLIIHHEFPQGKQIHKLRSRKSMMISSF